MIFTWVIFSWFFFTIKMPSNATFIIDEKICKYFNIRFFLCCILRFLRVVSLVLLAEHSSFTFLNISFLSLFLTYLPLVYILLYFFHVFINFFYFYLFLELVYKQQGKKERSDSTYYHACTYNFALQETYTFIS